MSNYIYNIGAFFSKISHEHKDRVALKYPDGNTVLFSELEILSNKIAHYLINKGLQTGDVIAIFNNKSPLGYATMLAALKTGIIYTNLDLTSPYQRIKKIVERCEPQLLVFDVYCEMKNDLVETGIPVVDLYENFEEQLTSFDKSLPSITTKIIGNSGAYIMFTSGSTGFPKGALITHANLLNFIAWGQSTYDITPDDICTNANPIYFDNSVFDFYVTLFSGAQLVPLTNDITHDPHQLIKAVAATGCTSWFSVPSLLIYLMTTKVLTANSLPAMKRFIFGGEGFPKLQLKKLFNMYHPQARLFNVYGPTECTCICSSHLITEADLVDMNSFATLGYLAPNFDYVLLNDDHSASFGELCLKGPNVGAGYYNDPERTKNAFIQNPNNGKYTEIVYRTGDLMQADEQGRLHFKGRADNQIKHMGYRIELEEIEAMLNTLHYVNEAAVIYERINESLGQIIAFVAIGTIMEDKEVIGDLKKLVPEYMVPKKLFIFEQLPKNQNGKIDRVSLKNYKA